MQAISRIAAVAVLVTSSAHAQQAPVHEPAAPAATPATIDHPPPPPELAPLSPDFQAAMANSQLQTYRFNQLTEQALALKKLCDTGFGPADICPKAGAAAGSAVAAEATGLPTVEEITGTHNGLSAVLVFPDGSHFTVHPGSVLPNGLVVVAITDDDVRVGRSPGRGTALPFGGGASAK
jgi:type IV pilus biogenesis protein PilP